MRKCLCTIGSKHTTNEYWAMLRHPRSLFNTVEMAALKIQCTISRSGDAQSSPGLAGRFVCNTSSLIHLAIPSTMSRTVYVGRLPRGESPSEDILTVASC